MCAKYKQSVWLLMQLVAIVSALPLNIKFNHNTNGAVDSIDDIVSLLKLRVDSEDIRRELRSLLDKTNLKRQEISKPSKFGLAKHQIQYEDNYYDYDEDIDRSMTASNQNFVPAIYDSDDLLMQSDITDTLAGNEDIEFLRQYRHAAYDDFEDLQNSDQRSYGNREIVDNDEYDYY